MSSGLERELAYFESSLSMRASFAVHDERGTNLLRIDCADLPWLSSDVSVSQRLKAEVEIGLGSVRKGTGSEWQHPESLRAALRTAICRVLADYEIDCVDPLLTLHIEQHSETLPFAPPSACNWIQWEPYGAFLVRNCARIGARSLPRRSQAPVTRFSPIPQHDWPYLPVHVPANLPFAIDRVALCIGEMEVAASDAPIITTGGDFDLPLPELPVGHYGDLETHDGQLVVQLKLANGDELDLPSAPVEIPQLESGPVALFVDMGSTFSKVIEVSLPYRLHHEEGAWDPAAATEIFAIIADAAAHSRIRVEQSPTAKFAERRGIPIFHKDRLANASTAQVASWIAAAIRALAAYHARQGRPIAAVGWSFPSLGGHNLTELSATVAGLVSAVVLGSIVVVGEHESLRDRFKGGLGDLAAAAQNAKRARAKAKKQNREHEAKKQAATQAYEKEKAEYAARWFKWFADEPSKPTYARYSTVRVPELAEWHRRFISCGADPDLENVLILDAGGYSLDVYCRIKEATLGQSFEAGGNQLTSLVQAFIAEKKGEPVSYEYAESKKVDIGSAGQPDPKGTLAREVQSWTREIYGKPVANTLRWIKNRLHGKGLPLILTGGAMENVYLRALILEQVAGQVAVVPTNGPEIALLIRSDAQLRRNDTLQRFQQIAHAFSPFERKPRSAYDIAGGLLEHYLRRDPP